MNPNQITLDNKLKQLATTSFKKIVSPMLRHESDIECFVEFAHGVLRLEPRVNEEDKGQIIGNYKSIRTLFALAGAKNGAVFDLKRLLPSVRGQRAIPRPFRPSNSWPLEEAEYLLENLMNLVLDCDFGIDRESKRGETTFHITIDLLEPFPLDLSDVIFALSKVMHAVGRTKGRILYVK